MVAPGRGLRFVLRARPVFWSVLAAAAFAASHGAAAEPRDELKRILDDWRERRGSLRQVHYGLSGTRFIPKGGLNSYNEDLLPRDGAKRERKTIPPADHTGPTSAEYWLDFAGGRARHELHWEAIGANLVFNPATTVAAYDGKALRRGDPTVEPGTRAIAYSDNVVAAMFHVEELPVLLAHGFVPPRIQRPGASPCFDTLPHSAFGVSGTRQHLGREVRVVKTIAEYGDARTFDEFWADPARSNLIVRWVRWRGGQRTYDSEIEYQQSQGAVLLRGYSLSNYDDKGVLEARLEMAATEATADAPIEDALFRLEIPEGMRVLDQAQWRVVEPHERATGARLYQTWLFELVLPLAIVVVVLLLVRRLRKGARKDPEAS
jgi:hypothetical protein